MPKITAPLGYNMTRIFESTSEDDVLKLTMSLSADPAYQHSMRELTHEQRLSILAEHGFEVEEVNV